MIRDRVIGKRCPVPSTDIALGGRNNRRTRSRLACRSQLEDALERARAREQAQGRPLSRRDVTLVFGAGECSSRLPFWPPRSARFGAAVATRGLTRGSPA